MSRYLQASAFIKSDINMYKQCNILLLGLCNQLHTQMAVKVQNSLFLFIIVECNCVLLNHFR